MAWLKASIASLGRLSWVRRCPRSYQSLAPKLKYSAFFIYLFSQPVPLLGHFAVLPILAGPSPLEDVGNSFRFVYLSLGNHNPFDDQGGTEKQSVFFPYFL